MQKSGANHQNPRLYSRECFRRGGHSPLNIITNKKRLSLSATEIISVMHKYPVAYFPKFSAQILNDTAHRNDLDIDSYAEIFQDKDNDYSDPLVKIYDYLSKEDADLLKAYALCRNKQEREKLAAKNGMTLNNLTTRISRIKKKLLDNIDN